MRVGLFERPAGREPADRGQPPVAALLAARRIGDEIFGADRNGDVEGAADVDAEEAGRRDPGDLEAFSFDRDGLARRDFPSAELSLPEALADDGRGCGAAGRVVAGTQHPAADRADADGVEKRPADVEALGIARLASGGEVDPFGAPDRELRERLLFAADAVPLRRGQLWPAAREASGSVTPAWDADVVELLRCRDREAPEPHGVQELEDGGVGPDAERERENRDQGEQRLETQAPGAVAEVSGEPRQPRGAVPLRRPAAGATARGGEAPPPAPAESAGLPASSSSADRRASSGEAPAAVSSA